MPMNTVPFTKRDIILIFKDGGTNYIEAVMESGNVSWTEGTPEAIYFMDRDSIADGETRDGADSPMELSMELAFTDAQSAAYQTLYGWLTRPSGSWEASNLTSSLGTGRDFRINVEMTLLGEKRGGVADQTLRFPHWRPKVSVAEGEFMTMSVSGTCKATQPEPL